MTSRPITFDPRAHAAYSRRAIMDHAVTTLEARRREAARMDHLIWSLIAIGGSALSFVFAYNVL